jgi:K+-transporting ATPase KdpF subunit
MNALLILAGIVALALLIYLFITLIKPEMFE